MLIGIIETGRPPGDLDQTHGNYPDMFARLLSSVADDLEFFTRAALDGDVPDNPGDADAWLITGSRYGVYERHDWIVRLEGFVRQIVSAEVPLVGICFGHQVIASALGGEVVKSDKGWGVGHHDYTVIGSRSWMSSTPDQLTLNAVHQDQVVALPDGASVLATSPFCENAVIAYGDSALTFQPHPEFNDDFKRDLIRDRLEEIVPEERMQAGTKSLESAMTTDIAATWIVDFLSHARAVAKTRRSVPEPA